MICDGKSRIVLECPESILYNIKCPLIEGEFCECREKATKVSKGRRKENEEQLLTLYIVGKFR